MEKKVLKKILLLCLFISQATYAQIYINSVDYKYPDFNYIESTIATASVHVPAGSSWTSIKVSPIKRKINGKKASITFRYYRPASSCNNRDPQRLLFMLAGLGGEANGGLVNLPARAASDKCLHVAVLSSVFSTDFVEAVSTRGVVGDFRNDIKDFYNYMIYVRDYIENYHSASFNSYAVAGFSLGGLTTAFVSELDSKRKVFNFRSALAINSPVDLVYGMNTLDGYTAEGEKISKVRGTRILVAWGRNLLRYRKSRTDTSSYAGFISRMSFLTEPEEQFVVGMVLQANLKDVILASQETLEVIDGRDLGVLSPAPRTNISSRNKRRQQQAKRMESRRKRQAKSYNFVAYMKDFVIKYLVENKNESDITIEELNYRNSLASIEGHIKSNQHFYMMHNADDFLIRKRDIDFMARTFGNRLTMYPRGGHVGNLWYKDNLNKFLKIITSN